MPSSSMDETVQRPMGRPSDERPSAAQLRVIFPPPLCATVPLGKGELVLGRKPGDGGHKLDDPTVSRQHQRVLWDRSSASHVVEDLGSRNGSRVEGKDLPEGKRKALDNNMLVRAGDVLMIYEVGEDIEADEAASVSREAIPGDAAATRQLRAGIAAAADDPSPILLIGETGTGKEFIAREIHRLSGRSGPLIPVNCAALNPQLIESQLFGHRRGAFTGAHTDHDGLFRAAEGGTIFLDEIGELPSELQPKLLRVLQEREVNPVGETRPVPVDVRVVSATLRDLTEMIDEGSFRLDLYARLSPWEILVPALRDRRADLLLWVERLYRDWHQERDKPVPSGVSLDANQAERLVLHDWADNLRGLDRLVHRACSEGGDFDVRPSLVSTSSSTLSTGVTVNTPKKLPKPTKEELEEILADNGGSVRATAKHYGRDRRQIYRWMEQYGLRDKE